MSRSFADAVYEAFGVDVRDAGDISGSIANIDSAASSVSPTAASAAPTSPNQTQPTRSAPIQIDSDDEWLETLCVGASRGDSNSDTHVQPAYDSDDEFILELLQRNTDDGPELPITLNCQSQNATAPRASDTAAAPEEPLPRAEPLPITKPLPSAEPLPSVQFSHVAEPLPSAEPPPSAQPLPIGHGGGDHLSTLDLILEVSADIEPVGEPISAPVGVYFDGIEYIRQDRLVTFDAFSRSGVVEHTATCISQLLSNISRPLYYIGITCCPDYRMTRSDCGYFTIGFQMMHLLATGCREEMGWLETQLLARFREKTGNYNIAKGGDGVHKLAADLPAYTYLTTVPSDDHIRWRLDRARRGVKRVRCS